MQKITDLGVLDGDVLVFGGPYSNLQALDALLEVAKARGISASNMICTGDLVAYCANPVEVVQKVRALGIPLVSGNCEIQLAEGSADCGCGFDEGSACSLLSKGWYGYARSQITPDLAEWMGQVPDRLKFEHCGRRFVVLHGGAQNVARFIWSVDCDSVFAEEMVRLEVSCGQFDVALAGHSGIAFRRDVGGKTWCNAGVIGMPANEGRAITEYCILSGGDISFHKLDYDFEAAASAMECAGLNQGYEKALRTGYWPSEDVLPPELRKGAKTRIAV